MRSGVHCLSRDHVAVRTVVPGPLLARGDGIDSLAGVDGRSNQRIRLPRRARTRRPDAVELAGQELRHARFRVATGFTGTVAVESPEKLVINDHFGPKINDCARPPLGCFEQGCSSRVIRTRSWDVAVASTDLSGRHHGPERSTTLPRCGSSNDGGGFSNAGETSTESHPERRSNRKDGGVTPRHVRSCLCTASVHRYGGPTARRRKRDVLASLESENRSVRVVTPVVTR